MSANRSVSIRNCFLIKPLQTTSELSDGRTKNGMILFVCPFPLPPLSCTYSGTAINVPSNWYLYVMMAGIKNEITNAEANTVFVHLVNFQMIIWMIVPQMTNWKSAAKYHACCIHYIKQIKLIKPFIGRLHKLMRVFFYRFIAIHKIVDVQ